MPTHNAFSFVMLPTSDDDSTRPITKQPKDCTECINDKHPENCRKRCTVLLKNKGFRVKPSTDSN